MKTETVLNMIRLNRDVVLEVYRFAGDDDVKRCRETCKTMRDASEMYVYRDSFYIVKNNVKSIRVAKIIILDHVTCINPIYVEEAKIKHNIFNLFDYHNLHTLHLIAKYECPKIDLSRFQKLNKISALSYSILEACIINATNIHTLHVDHTYDNWRCYINYNTLFPNLTTLSVCNTQHWTTTYSVPNTLQNLCISGTYFLARITGDCKLRFISVEYVHLISSVLNYIDNIEMLHIDTLGYTSYKEDINLCKYKNLKKFTYSLRRNVKPFSVKIHVRKTCKVVHIKK